MAKKKNWEALTAGLDQLPTVAPERKAVVGEIQGKVLAGVAEPPPPLAEDDPSDADLLAAMNMLFVQLMKRKTVAVKAVTSAEFSRVWLEIRDIEDQLSGWTHAAGVMDEALMDLAVQQLKAEGVKSLRLPDGRGVTTWPEPYPSIEDEGKWRQWCKDNGYEPKMNLLWQTMRSIVNERLEKGEPLPDGIKVWSTTVIRKLAAS